MNDLQFILQYAKVNNIINKMQCRNLIEYSFDIVKLQIPELLEQSKYLEIAELLFDKKFRIIKIQELISFILWVRDEILHINKIEKAKLHNNTEPELIQAGIKQLDVFGNINIIDSLANGDVLKWDLILQLPYYRVLDKLAKSNVENQIQKNYQKIMEQKSKRK